MRFGIQSWGSEGDNRPLLALAGGLSSAGHTVDLVVSSIEGLDYSEYADREGIRLRQTDSLNYSPRELESMGKKAVSYRNSLSQFRFVLDHLFNPLIEDIWRESQRLCEVSDAVIGHFVVYPLSIAAEASGLPHITVTTTPSIIPSAYFRHPGIPWMGKKLNSLIWKSGSILINRILRDNVNRMRESEGLSTPPRNAFSLMTESRLLNLIQASPELVTPAPDWGSHNRLCGNLRLSGDVAAEALPAEIEKFLESGPPPLFVTFGSMMLFEPFKSETIELAASSARDAGFRAIIQYDSKPPPDVTSDPGILLVRRIPHDMVFQRCCGIVHHGGAGTSHTAARSGVPSIVVMFGVDQFYWGSLLVRKGTAVSAIPRRVLTRQKLADAMNELRNNPSYKKVSEEIAGRMRTEDGVGRAVEIIEEAMRDGYSS